MNRVRSTVAAFSGYGSPPGSQSCYEALQEMMCDCVQTALPMAWALSTQALCVLVFKRLKTHQQPTVSDQETTPKE